MNILFKNRLVITSLLMMSVMAAQDAKAQGETIVLPSRTMTVGELISAIQGQTRYIFAFDSRAFDTARQLTLVSDNMSVKEAVDKMMAGTDNSYMLRERYIIVKKKPVRKAAADVAATGDRYRPTIIGEVVAAPNPRPEGLPDKDGAPLPEADAAGRKDTLKPGLPSEGYSLYKDPDIYSPMKDKLPVIAVRINVLYGAAALTPNLSAEIGLGRRSTLELSGSYNPWNRIGTLNDNDKLVHWVVRPEYRFWFCERFDGHFVGAHAFYSKYNISGYRVPGLFKKEHRYEGSAYGGGVSYGYHLPLGRRWGLEFNAGVGVARLKYDRFDCSLCSYTGTSGSKTYFGPTRLGVTVVFIIK